MWEMFLVVSEISVSLISKYETLFSNNLLVEFSFTSIFVLLGLNDIIEILYFYRFHNNGILRELVQGLFNFAVDILE